MAIAEVEQAYREPISGPERPQPSPPPVSSTFPKPRRIEVIDAIRVHTGVSHRKAKTFLSWISLILTTERKNGYAGYYLTSRERHRYHGLMDALAPDRVRSVPGDVLSMIEEFLLEPKRGEAGLMHDYVIQEDGDRLCMMQVCITVVIS